LSISSHLCWWIRILWFWSYCWSTCI